MPTLPSELKVVFKNLCHFIKTNVLTLQNET